MAKYTNLLIAKMRYVFYCFSPESYELLIIMAGLLT